LFYISEKRFARNGKKESGGGFNRGVDNAWGYSRRTALGCFWGGGAGTKTHPQKGLPEANRPTWVRGAVRSGSKNGGKTEVGLDS